MSIAILIATAVAFWHALYEGVLAPSFRETLRNRLFELRDDLRRLRLASNAIRDDEFEVVQTGINNFVNRLDLVTISFNAKFAREYQHDLHLRNHVKSRYRTIEQSKSEDLKRIARSVNRTIEQAFLVNSGGWAIYVLPAVVIVLLFQSIAKLTKRIFFATESDVARLMPKPSELSAHA